MSAKRSSKLYGQPSETLFYNPGLYILFINTCIFFPESIMSGWTYIRGGLITGGIFKCLSLYVYIFIFKLAYNQQGI